MLDRPPDDAVGRKQCRRWIQNRTASGYNRSTVEAACSFGSAEARDCAKTCCLLEAFDPLVAPDPQSVRVRQPFWKASQWSTLWFEHARHLVSVAPAQSTTWSNAFVPDEHFAVNNLVVAGLPFSQHGLTHLVGYEWLAKTDGAHAITVDCSADLTDRAASALTKTFANATVMRMNGQPSAKGMRRSAIAKKRQPSTRSAIALGTCLDSGDCHTDGKEVELPKGDTPIAQEAIHEMVGNKSDADELRTYQTFMINAAVLGKAFGRKFAPGCVEQLVKHQRSMAGHPSKGGVGSPQVRVDEPTAEAAPAVPATIAAPSPCHDWVAANAPAPRRPCERKRPLFVGGGEGKTGTTALWYSLASLGLVAAHSEHVLRCNASAINEPLVQVFDDQPPIAHGACHELSGAARDPQLSRKYKKIKNMLYDPDTDYAELDWCALFDDYDAVLDSPIPNLLPYIYQAFGDTAKVILTVRDAQDWVARRQEWSATWSEGRTNTGDPTPLAWMASGHVGGRHPSGSGAVITNVTADSAQWLYAASVSLAMCLVRPADLLVVDYFKTDSAPIESKIRGFVAGTRSAQPGLTGVELSDPFRLD